MAIFLNHNGDLPARSGIGSSASFTVSLVIRTLPSKNFLKPVCILSKQKEAADSQDHTAATYGGLNHIKFGMDGTITAKKATKNQSRVEILESHLMLFYTKV